MEQTRPESPESPLELSSEQAIAWLRSVDGELYRTPHDRRREGLWVAVVRTPDLGLRRAQLIIAVGDTALEAAGAAACQWRAIWGDAPQGH